MTSDTPFTTPRQGRRPTYMSNDTPKGDRIAKVLARAGLASRRGAEAMIEAGRMDLDLEDVDLGSVIEESIEMVVSKAEDTQIAVRSDITGDLGTIRADERRIRQILFNLISNSLRFTESGGEIVISAQRMGDMVTFSVRDNGRGLEADKRATSFDSFVSGDQRGAGLGLALVKHFVDLHGGTVGMKPVEGGGLEVTCWLPAQAMRAVSAQRELLLSENVVPS